MNSKKYSLLYPKEDVVYKKISLTTMHDLGLDSICKQLSVKEAEQNMILNILSKTCDDAYVIGYRCDVFEDILNNKKMREDLMEILDRINFIRDYGGINQEYDEKTNIWDLMHRLDEINDYIKCVDALHECLSDKKIKSEGLIGLREYIEKIYSDNGFAQLKEDISKLNFDTSKLKSITVGINLNSRFEAVGIGLVSINNKYFTESGIISNFCGHISSKDKINDDVKWKENYKYHSLETHDFSSATEFLHKAAGMGLALKNPIFATTGVAAVAEDDSTKEITHYMDRVVNQMISGMVKKLKDVLNRYVSITITDMTDLIPELFYYIKWAEFVEKQTEKGTHFAKPEVIKTSDKDKQDVFLAKARGIYNIKLAVSDEGKSENIVTNDIDFDKEHRVYILTGANRGGKTTITQTIGQLFVLAQGGIYIPGEEFKFSPTDCVYTHFPADEDKTFDLGRLGEECKRFKEMYSESTEKSLLLMNETFSTTSFEEGYYIARDSVRAILSKGVRTVYNTHMHKLAYDIDELNNDNNQGKAYSLIVHNEGEKRSYKIEIAPPTGKSFASDIAKKYGVTYDLLTKRDLTI